MRRGYHVARCGICDRRRHFRIIEGRYGYRTWRCSQGHIKEVEIPTLEKLNAFMKDIYEPMLVQISNLDSVIYSVFKPGGR